MELNKSHISIGAVCLLAGIVLGAGFRSCSSKPAEPALRPEVIHDTIEVQDSAWLAEHTKPKYVIRRDTLWLPKVDSAENAHSTTDAEFALVPITQSEYRDTFTTDSTRAEVAVLFSGYNTRIDSVGINYQATIQPVVREKESGWGWSVTVGPYVGYGVTINNGRVLAGPEIGLGVQLGIGYQKKFKSLKRI